MPLLETTAILLWLVVQGFLTIRLFFAAPKKEVLLRYPFPTRLRLLSPIFSNWERLVAPGDREQFASCRKWLGLWQLSLLVFTVAFVAYVGWLSFKTLGAVSA